MGKRYCVRPMARSQRHHDPSATDLIDRGKLRVALRRLGDEYIYYMLDDAIELTWNGFVPMARSTAIFTPRSRRSTRRAVAPALPSRLRAVPLA